MRYDTTEQCKSYKVHYNVYYYGVLVRMFKTEGSSCAYVEKKIKQHHIKAKFGFKLQYEYIIEEVTKRVDVQHRRMYSAS